MMPTTVEERARTFRDSRKTLHLATFGLDGTPTASYAPFVREETNFYIYTSALSRHTKDMLDTGKASVLLIEDESGAANLFARKRITFSCLADTIWHESDFWRDILDLFEKSFGNIFGLIRPLGDFNLFRLVPYEAVYVEGFGQAYRLKPNLSKPIHIRGAGPSAHNA